MGSPPQLPVGVSEAEVDQRSCGPGVGRPSPPLSPVLDTQDELVEAVHMLKAGFVSDGVDDEEAVPRTHVLLPHGTELLLPSRVQHWGRKGHSGAALHQQGPPRPSDPKMLLSSLWLCHFPGDAM